MTLECFFCYCNVSVGTQNSDLIHDKRLNGLRATGILLPSTIFENVPIDSYHTDFGDKREVMSHLLQVHLPHGSSAHLDTFLECSEPFFVVDGLKLESKDWAGQPFARIQGMTKGEPESLSPNRSFECDMH